MHLVSLAVTDFRNLAETDIELDPEGTTVITGPNGAGKTSLLEATAYLATLESFRGSPKEALVRRGTKGAILRAHTVVADRSLTIEAEVLTTGRSRTQVNRQVVRRRADLHEALRVTVFSPEDIGMVRAGPSDRRRFLDETLAVVDPKAARSAEEVEKVLRQRAALLRTSGSALQADTATTLDVWDARLDDAGTRLVESRELLVDQLAPLAGEHYSRLAGTSTDVGLTYVRSWSGRLLDALAGARTKDIQRGISTVGPHRDELELTLNGLPSRTHASQGEQRSLALALQLAAHQLATERLGTAPVLLLDDVFSELDPRRSRALLAGLPPGQAMLTTAQPAPPEVAAAKVYAMDAGGHVAASRGRS
ncbi:MAG: DNA replication and repair protein RecF [Acidimicrobiales bacterium]